MIQQIILLYFTTHVTFPVQSNVAKLVESVHSASLVRVIPPQRVPSLLIRSKIEDNENLHVSPFKGCLF